MRDVRSSASASLARLTSPRAGWVLLLLPGRSVRHLLPEMVRQYAVTQKLWLHDGAIDDDDDEDNEEEEEEEEEEEDDGGGAAVEMHGPKGSGGVLEVQRVTRGRQEGGKRVQHKL